MTITAGNVFRMLGYSIPQFLPRPEMDHGLGFHVHSSASFRVSLHGRRMVAQGEGPEAPRISIRWPAQSASVI